MYNEPHYPARSGVPGPIYRRTAACGITTKVIILKKPIAH
jgi:hypothetical protein